MSVIVAIKENGIVYMGADSQTTAGIYKRAYLNENAFKVARLSNGMLLGFCGMVRTKQAMLGKEDVFTLDENGELTKKHIVQNIIPKLVGMIDANGDEQNGEIEVSILLAHKDKLYKITSKLDVLALNEFARSGSGFVYVNYALMGMKHLPVRERILKALTQSAKWADAVSGPYVCIDTKNLEYEVVDMGGKNY